jgi:2'-hydroxyisoflavone reductase
MRQTRRDYLTRSAAAATLLAVPEAEVMAAPAKKLRILILGGTGFTGPHQVRYALARGHKVTIFNRGRRLQTWPGPVEELIGDRNTGDLKALEGREWDVCIDNPTTLPFWVRDAGRVLKGKVKQYIFISTISVYASNARPADETDPVQAYAGGDPMAVKASNNSLYGPLKAVSEAEARRQFGEGATTVIRPGLIVGPGDETDRFTYWPVRLANPGGKWGGEVLAPGDGTDPVQFIDARDLAEWTIRMAETRTTGTFNGTGPATPLSTGRFLAEVAAGVRVQPKLTWVATKFLETQGVSPWSDLPVWIPGQGETAGFARRNIGRALKAGLTYRPLGVTAADTLTWYRQQPAERQSASIRAGLTPQREAAVLGAWRSTAAG